MTKQELIEVLTGLQGSSDIEMAHGEADDAVMDFLKSEGHEDIVELFNKIEKWYA